MTRVKGTAVVSTLRFVGERFGEDGLKSVLADLSPEDRAQVETGALASAWYPFALLLRIMKAAGTRFGGKAPELYREMGEASAEHGLTTVYKIFFRVGSPQFIISRASAVFKNYYDSGEMKAVVSEKGHAVLELAGFAEPAPEFCERVVGWMQRTLELSGGTDLRIVHPTCAVRGDRACRFEGWWT